MVWKCLAILVGSFLIGSMSFSILASKKLFGGDIRDSGSGNAGATNMARVHGWGAGLLTLAGDALKAAVCMMAGNALCGEIGLCIGAGACMLGHCFPVLHGFKGGKGIAVGGAVGHNPISLIIPCHRVIGSDGHLTGYAGGLERKQWLLELESGHTIPPAGSFHTP